MKRYDIKNNIITFKDGTKCNIISREKKKEIMSYLRKYQITQFFVEKEEKKSQKDPTLYQ